MIPLHVAIMSHPRRLPHPSLRTFMANDSEPVRSMRLCTEGYSAWDCARRAWEHLAQYHGTALLLHDDMRLCPDFAFEVARLPQPRAYSLWHNSAGPDGLTPVLFAPGGAFVMPCRWILPFLEWQEKHVNPEWACDDTRFALWCAAKGISIHVPFPNLVQHEGEKSVARPGQSILTSPTFGRTLPRVWLSGPSVSRRDREQFVISRKMHFVGAVPEVR